MVQSEITVVGINYSNEQKRTPDKAVEKRVEESSGQDQDANDETVGLDDNPGGA